LPLPKPDIIIIFAQGRRAYEGSAFATQVRD